MPGLSVYQIEVRFHHLFLTNDKRKPVSVLLPIEEYHEILEDLEDLAVLVQRKDEPDISYEEVFRELELEDSL